MHNHTLNSRQPAIVLVDDEPNVAMILPPILHALVPGVEIVSVQDAASALTQLELRPVRLVLTDFHMPGMNGLELTGQIKERWPETKVILVTAYAARKLEQNAHEAQIDYILPKPFAIEHLEQVVQAALGR